MATIQIVIHTDGDAFKDNPCEVSRLLRVVAAKWDTREEAQPGESVALIDTNGYLCGAVAVTP